MIILKKGERIMAEFEIRNGVLVKAYYVMEQEKVMIPETVEIIGEGAFCQNPLVQEVIMPDSVTKIDKNAFSGCGNLKKVRFSNSVTEICDGAFEGCFGLKEIKIPDSVIAIGENAFNLCMGLEKIQFSESLRILGNNCFEDCRSLKEINLPDSLITIGDFAFMWCLSLKRVCFSDSVKNIGIDTFAGCRYLKKLEVEMNGEVKYHLPVLGKFPNLYHESVYDKLFVSFTKETQKIEAAFLRLKNKYHLGEDDRKNYEEYLRQNAKEAIQFCIDYNRMDLLKIGAEINLLTKENLLWAIDLINKNQSPEITAFLLTYQKNFEESLSYLNLEE